MKLVLTQRQMELELASARGCPHAARRQHRASRANWWFNQMRELVDRAFDYEPAPEPRFRTELIEAPERISNQETKERRELDGNEHSTTNIQHSTPNQEAAETMPHA